MELKYVPTTCPYCGVGCGLYLVVRDGRVVGTAPWKSHPVNEGKLCLKGRKANEFIHHQDRLTKPLIKRNGRHVAVSWNEALDLVVSKLSAFTGTQIACLSSARCTNEENYLFQKLARVALKTPHIDHCARLCHSSTVAGLAASFGSGAMTNSDTDIERADCILIIGSNTFEQHPLLARRVIRARLKGAKVVCADPRFTPTAAQSDLYLPIIPGSDVQFLNGLIRVILDEGLLNKEFIEARTDGFERLREYLLAGSVAEDAEACGVCEEDLRTAARWYARAGAASILYAMGLTQHVNGTDGVRAAANLALVTGNIGRPGTGVNPLRGQNNVQGACDMGALPNVYSGYQAVTDAKARQRMERAWGCPVTGGSVGYTMTEVFNQLADGHADIKAMYIMGENPLLSEPHLHHVKEACQALEFLMVQDIFMTETARLADVVLPAACWAEKDGTFTSTARRVNRVRKAVDPPGEAWDDWRIIGALGAAMGFKNQFSYPDAAAVFSEIAEVTPSYHGMSYARLEQPGGLQWPCPSEDHPGTAILHRERFAAPDGRAVFYVAEPTPPAEVPGEQYPLRLTTGRVAAQWHTGSMSRRSPSLEREAPYPLLEIHPDDALPRGIEDGCLVRVATRRGTVDVKARVTGDIKPGVVFLPFHYAEAPANLLTNNALDPVAKIPDLKVCACQVERVVDSVD